MAKKIIACFMVLMMAFMLFAGCSNNTNNNNENNAEINNGDNNNSTENNNEQEQNKEDIEISIMFNGVASESSTQLQMEMIEDFNSSDDYDFKVKDQYYENEQYKTKLATLMASDSVTDIFFTWELDFLRPYVEADKVYPLTDALDSDSEWKNIFSEGVFEPVSYDGDIYGVPSKKSFCAMFYNTKIFEENDINVPETYDDFLNLCETLKNNDITPMLISAEDAWIPAQFVQQIANGIAGMELYNGIIEGEKKWNDDAHIEAATEVQKMVEKGYFQEGFLGTSPDEVRNQFKQGEGAMYFMGVWDAGTILDEETSKIVENVSAFILPAMNPEYNNISVGSIDGTYCVSQSSDYKEEAIEFIKYYTSIKNQEIRLYQEGELPSAKIDIDTSKLKPLIADIIELSNQSKGLTPWWDRAFGAGEGVEFNNKCLAVLGGGNPTELFDELQQYAEENSDR